MKTYFAALLCLGLVACNDQAETYRARTVLQVSLSPNEDSVSVARHAELAIGGSVLEAVAEKLQLAEQWKLDSDQLAVDQLATQVDSAVVAGSDLIEITVKRTDRAEAVQIANAIAEAFRDKLNAKAEEDSERALQALEDQIEAQKKKLEESRVKLLEIMEKHRIVDLSQAQPKWLQERNAEEPVAELRATIEALNKLEGDELLRAAIDLGAETPTLTMRYPEYQSLMLQMEALRTSGLGAKHPKIVIIGKQIEQMRVMLLQAVEQARETLNTKLKMLEETVAAARKNAEDEAEERRARITYVETKREYELAKELLATMQASLASKRVDLSRPAPRVVIHELAR